MMSDMSVSSRASENQKQLDELKADHERKLSQLRSDQQRKVADIEANGDAAISHIKKRVNDRVENSRESAETKLAREDEAIQQNYSELKKRASHQTNSLEKQTRAERERVENNKAAMHDEETRTIRQSQSKLKEFLVNQDEQKSQAQKQTTQTVSRYQKSSEEKLGEAKKTYSAELQATEADGQKKINETRERSNQLYNATRSEADRRLKELKVKEDTQVGAETAEAKSSINRVRSKVKEATVQEEREGQRKIALTNEMTKKQIEDTKNRALLVNEKLQAEYSSEGQRIETEGGQDIQFRQNKFEHLRKEQAAANDAQLNEQNLNQHKSLVQARAEYESRLQHTVTALDQAMDEERKGFTEKYTRDSQAHTESLRNNKEVYLRELYKQKQELDKRSRLESHRGNDPFYRMRAFDAKISETGDHYVLKAKVAPHEKDSVDVIVKDDRVILSARRQFQDNTEGDGIKSSTNSYQTYRQEFALGKEVDAKKVVRNIADDGTITAYIPKQAPRTHAKT